MSEILKVVLSLSISGSLLILILLLCRPLVKDRCSKKWQYYIWLIVIARLLLPFAPQTNLMGALFKQAGWMTQTAPVYESDRDAASILASDAGSIDDGYASETDNNENWPDSRISAGNNHASQTEDRQKGPDKGMSTRFTIALSEIWSASAAFLWPIWLGVALALLIRKITVYQSFVNYIKAGWEEASDIALLDRLAQIGDQTGIRRPVELYTNRLVSSPLLLGFFRPRVVLPTANLPDKDFQYTIRHELIHYKHLDMFYKWLAQAVICIHWFNPLVWLMGRELNRACELACDEAVIKTLDIQERRSYGDTLLHAAGAGGCYKNSISSTTLCESAILLKERLEAIMNFKQKKKMAAALSVFSAVALTSMAVSAGAYTRPANRNASSAQSLSKEASSRQSHKKDTASKLAEKFYDAENIALFKAVFLQMDEAAQKKWLNKFYSNGEIAFFSAALNELDADNPLIDFFSEKAYKDREIAFFSVLTGNMEKDELESWLERALNDKITSFAAMLYEAADMEEERNAMEEKLEKQRLEEYKTYGITKKGNNYYYKGKLVSIIVDSQSDGCVYALNIHPSGTVNIKITRSKDGKIKRVSKMTKEEAKKLFGDIQDPDDKRK